MRFDVIDACAAPGNKTSHAASLLAGAKGSAVSSDSKVFAFDKSTRRLALMERRMKEAGADAHVECRAADFLRVSISDTWASTDIPVLKVDPHAPEYAHVRAVRVQKSLIVGTVHRLIFHVPQKVLLDPSCSGSGMLRQNFTEDVLDEERLDSLFRFQLAALRKAFTFPQVSAFC
jgi:putative methyltransferase